MHEIILHLEAILDGREYFSLIHKLLFLAEFCLILSSYKNVWAWKEVLRYADK